MKYGDKRKKGKIFKKRIKNKIKQKGKKKGFKYEIRYCKTSGRKINKGRTQKDV